MSNPYTMSAFRRVLEGWPGGPQSQSRLKRNVQGNIFDFCISVLPSGLFMRGFVFDSRATSRRVPSSGYTADEKSYPRIAIDTRIQSVIRTGRRHDGLSYCPSRLCSSTSQADPGGCRSH